MPVEQIIELVGYCASLLVLISLLMTSVIKLRIINTIGSLIFTIYALLIRSYPTAMMNFCLVLVNLWFLAKLLGKKTDFDLAMSQGTDAAVDHFLKIYGGDIRALFPDWQSAIAPEETVCLVYDAAVPVALLVGTREESTLRVRLDYSCPAYRDCSVGKYLYEKLETQGISRLTAQPSTEPHRAYLEKVGFRQAGTEFVRDKK